MTSMLTGYRKIAFAGSGCMAGAVHPHANACGTILTLICAQFLMWRPAPEPAQSQAVSGSRWGQKLGSVPEWCPRAVCATPLMVQGTAMPDRGSDPGVSPALAASGPVQLLWVQFLRKCVLRCADASSAPVDQQPAKAAKPADAICAVQTPAGG